MNPSRASSFDSSSFRNGSKKTCAHETDGHEPSVRSKAGHRARGSTDQYLGEESKVVDVVLLGLLDFTGHAFSVGRIPHCEANVCRTSALWWPDGAAAQCQKGGGGRVNARFFLYFTRASRPRRRACSLTTPRIRISSSSVNKENKKHRRRVTMAAQCGNSVACARECTWRKGDDDHRSGADLAVFQF